SDGSPDMSFGTGGTTTVNFAGSAAPAIQPDGKILAVADTGSADFAVARLQPGGAPDTTFSSDGMQTVDFSGLTAQVSGVALAPTGGIGLAGHVGTDNPSVAVARLEGDSGGSSGGGPGGGGGGAGGNGSPPRCGGKRATIVGTSHADHLKGTKHADVIAGL